MYSIAVRVRFHASHSIVIDDHPRETPHAHDWLVEAEVATETLDRHGLVMDFHLLERLLGECVADFQDAVLDELPPFIGGNPTAEQVATVIFTRLEAHVPAARCRLERVTAWETADCAATRRREGR